MIAGLAAHAADDADRRAAGARRPGRRRRSRSAQLPPVGSLFAAFLGYNPIAEPARPDRRARARCRRRNAATLTGKQFFPQLISGPFHDGLVVVFVRGGGDDARSARVASFATGPRGQGDRLTASPSAIR